VATFRDGRQAPARAGAGQGRRVLIAGAGIAGLATALRLQRSGWDTLVVERSATRRAGGYMVNLLGSGYDAAQRFGILPALQVRDLGAFTSILVKADGRHKFTLPDSIARAALGSLRVEPATVVCDLEGEHAVRLPESHSDRRRWRGPGWFTPKTQPAPA
jgi:nucleoside-diphosphate-sugar epimerase